MEWLLGGGLLMLLAMVVWILPLVLILRSDRTEGLEKAIWVLLVLFVSWFAWIVYWLLAPLADKFKRT